MSLILVPTDLQAPRRAAFHAAARAARAFDAKVALLHVVPRPEIPAPPGVRG